MTRHEEMRRSCQAFHGEHPEVWKLFVRFTMEKVALGYDNFGAKAVMERIRWETSAGGDDPELKIGNNHTAFYARRFNRLNPDLGDGRFFRLREQTSHYAPATGLSEFVVNR